MRYRERAEHRALRVVGSTTGLIVIALGIGLIVAASIGAIIWVISSALHHAANQ
ncbi:MAG: hypothetical protein M0Z30_11230 [Actinomycetota bacterium]|nr:hypothetical protein [Actinomycetota bacterium]